MSWESLANRLLLASLELTVLFVVVGIALRMLKVQSARVRSLLWLVVLGKPLLTLCGLTLFPVVHLGSMGLAGPETYLKVVEVNTIERAPASRTGAPGELEPLMPLGEPQDAPLAALPPVVGMIWLAGIAAFLVWIAYQRISLQLILGRTLPARGKLLALYSRCCRELAQRHPPRLRVTEDLDSPALAGVLFPTILVPGWMSRESGAEQILWVLKHELRHDRHRDPLAGTVRRVTQTLLFFHPLAWWASRLWEESTEMACDEAVVQGSDQARRYAEELVAILLRVRDRRRVLAPSGLHAAKTQIKKRIATLLKLPPRDRRPGPCTRVAVFALSAVLLSAGFGSDDPVIGDEPKIKLAESREGEPTSRLYREIDVEEESVRERRILPIDELANLSLELTFPSRKIAVRASGGFKLSPDLGGIKKIAKGGWFSVEDHEKDAVRSLLVTPSPGGDLEYDHRVDDEIVAFDDEAHRWLGEVLQRFAKDLR